jgi:hypothetical protein
LSDLDVFALPTSNQAFSGDQQLDDSDQWSGKSEELSGISASLQRSRADFALAA